jgi:membrane associated rhomboid family serine protease
MAGEGGQGAAAGPWGGLGRTPPPREPLTRAPWPPLLLAAAFLGVYALQAADGQAALCAAGDPAAACARYAFAPVALDHGRYLGLVTALFMHGSWAHVGFNSIFAVAFGAPLARMFGARWSGALALLVFFLICGVAGNLGYALVRPHSAVPVIGASGGVAGFMGAASRLIGRPEAGPRADLAPFWSRTVIGMAAAWITVNLIVGVLGVDIGFGAAGQPVAWEAHLFGYFAGLLLAWPALALARRLE